MAKRSLVRSGKGLVLARRLHRICEEAGYKSTLVNVWHNGPSGTIGYQFRVGTLAFTVADPRRPNEDGHPHFVGFVLVEPPCNVIFTGGAELGAVLSEGGAT